MPLSRANTTTLSRSGPAIAVMALHAALIYTVVVSTGIVKAPQFTTPFETVFIDEPPPVDEAPPELPVDVQIDTVVPIPQTPVVDLDDIVAPATDIVAPPSENAIAATVGPVTEQRPSAAPQQLRTTHRVEPVYPAVSRRMGEEGTVRLKVLVDERGRPITVDVTASSGHSRLDQAAIDAVKRWRFVAPTDGNRAIQAWTQVAITFKLTDAQR